MEIMTHDNEWSHEELYGVAYDECIKACRNIGFLLDTPNLDKPNILMEVLMDELDEDKNLVDYYDEMLADALIDNGDIAITAKISDKVFARWDQWMIDRIQSTLKAHKYKHYVRCD